MSRESSPDRIGHLIARFCHLDHRRVHGSVEGLGLHRGQPSVLRALWEHDGITHSDLARRLHRSSATITVMIKRMEKTGFVERRSDPRDERVSRVYLTDAGRDTKAAVEDALHKSDEQTFAGFSDEEIAVLRGFLLRIIQNIEDRPSSH